MSADVRMVEIPWPMVRPLWVPLSAGGVREVWDTFVKPIQDSGDPPSVEERCLMAILRSVFDGLSEAEDNPDLSAEAIAVNDRFQRRANGE